MTDSLSEAKTSAELVSSVIEGFRAKWGATPDYVAVAPGRVNVIGEHVDYNGGWVLPAAIERYMVFGVKARTDGKVRLADENFPGTCEFEIDDIAPDAAKDWSKYFRGVMAGIDNAGYELTGFDGYLDSTIPVGGGLSSSAAIESVAGLAILSMIGEEMNRFSLAKLCQKAEHEYAGVPCGIMDQAAILNCKRDHLLFLDCEKETFDQALFDAPDWRLMIVNSGVAHALADGEYAKRRAACHKAADVLDVLSLRHIDIENLDELLGNQALDEEMVRCVRHNVTENDRTHKTVKALAEGEIELAGQLLNASHASLRDDYRVSCPELDFIAATAQTLDGVAGCRMTGGGFGGSCIALVHKDAAEPVAEAIDKAYEAEFGKRPSIFLTAAEAGAYVQKIG
ncbi:MAG: galactokinase [Puniceicoccaceae bacterium]